MSKLPPDHSDSPPWEPDPNWPRKKKDEWRATFIEWSCRALDDRDCRSLREANESKEADEFAKFLWSEEHDIESARAGDIEPLRKRYPHLRDFLQAPKLKRGEKYTKERPKLLDAAREKAKNLRKVWREVYGKSRRSTPTAEEIVAVCYGLELDELLKHRSGGGRKRKKPAGISG